MGCLCTLRPVVSESVGESVEGIREIVTLLPVSRRCHVDCVTRDVTWRQLWARHFPGLSPSVAACNWFIPSKWFIVIRDLEWARVNWYKNHQGPRHALPVRYWTLLWLHNNNNKMIRNESFETELINSGWSLFPKGHSCKGWVSLSAANYDDLEPIWVRGQDIWLNFE